MRRAWVVLMLLGLWIPALEAQEVRGTILLARVVEGDTIPFVHIREVIIMPQRKFRNRRSYREYERMIINLKKVYPYAQEAKLRLREMDSVYATLTSDWDRRRYAAHMERELSRQFERQLRALTFSQGRMLIKLIDRETGRTTYDIIRHFRGSLTATVWQGVAKLFGSNLRSTFDAAEEDRLLNELIILYEHGQL